MGFPCPRCHSRHTSLRPVRKHNAFWTCLGCGHQFSSPPRSRGSEWGCLLVVVLVSVTLIKGLFFPSAHPPPNKPAPASNEMKATLSTSHNLIKAKVYPPARKNLQGIIDEAPGTPEADHAKTLLDSIPK
jgi:hypothetical protein